MSAVLCLAGAALLFIGGLCAVGSFAASQDKEDGWTGVLFIAWPILVVIGALCWRFA